MNFEEKLNKLIERHEALTLTVELLTQDIKETSSNIAQLYKNSLILHDSIKSLENIALAHENRIQNLENEK